MLEKTEEIEFPDHEDAPEGESLIADVHPDITRKGFVVNLLITLDNQFHVFCEILRDGTKQRLKWNDLKGSPLERFLSYSDKVCDLRLGYDQETLSKVRGLIEVRNCIIHNLSNVEGFGKPQVVEQFSCGVDGARIEDGYIMFDLAGCHACADIVLGFMEQAYHAALNVFPK